MSNYLRNRPFMVVTYAYVLADGQKSQTKGFGATAEWNPVENMVIVDRVSNKQMSKAELILDLLENKVIKCRDLEVDQKAIFEVFVRRHIEDVKAALLDWVAKDPDNLAKVQAFVESFKKEEPTDG